MATQWVKSRVTRRTFLKGAVASGFALGMPSLLAEGQMPSTPLTNSFRALTTTHWGPFTAVVQGGRFTDVIPWEKDPNPSPILQGMQDRVYNPNRIKYPMVRAGYLKDGIRSDTAERGQGNFVRVSWDQALDLVAAEVDRVRTEYGNQAIFGGSYGWRSAGKLHTSQVPMQRFLGLAGGFVNAVNDYSIGAGEVILPHVIGFESIFGPVTTWPSIIENSKLIVLWGSNPLITTEVVYGTSGIHQITDYLRQVKDAGIEVVSINPQMTDTAQFFNARWVAPRPNTDLAIMLAMCYTLITENLHDQAFVDTYTTGFEQVKEYILGTVDGQPKTPEWAESISEVPATVIVELARKMAANRTMLMWSWSLQRQDRGDQVFWGMITLAAMLGQIGLPGGGFGSYHFEPFGVPPCAVPYIPGLSGGENPVKDYIPVARISDLLLNPGKTIDFNGQKITYPDIKLVYWAGGNPFHHHQDVNTLIKAWRRPDTTIVQDPWWTATAKFADIVLPATTEFERNDIDGGPGFGGTGDPYIVFMKKLIEPLFEARNDLDIFVELSDRLGFKDKYTEGRDEMGWLRFFYSIGQAQAAAQSLAMPDFDAFMEQGFAEFPRVAGADKYVMYGAFRESPAEHPLGTPSGKIELYSKTIEGFGYADSPPYAAWQEPAEWLGSPKAQQYPLHVLSEHPKYRLHSQMNNTWIRHLDEVSQREPVWISPQDAAARGIQDGDVVRVFNDRGQLLAGARVSDRVRKGVVRICEGAWYDPMEPGKIGTLCKHGHVNSLTLDKGTTKLAMGNIANTVLVEIEKYTGAVPEITAFDPARGG